MRCRAVKTTRSGILAMLQIGRMDISVESEGESEEEAQMPEAQAMVPSRPNGITVRTPSFPPQFSGPCPTHVHSQSQSQFSNLSGSAARTCLEPARMDQYWGGRG